MTAESKAVRCRRCGKVIGVREGNTLTVKWCGRTVIATAEAKIAIICERCKCKNTDFSQ